MSTTQTTMSTTQTTMSTEDKKKKDEENEQTKKIIGALLILLIIGLILYLIFKPKSTDVTSTTSTGLFKLTDTPKLLEGYATQANTFATELRKTGADVTAALPKQL
jgi:hypothetical protein